MNFIRINPISTIIFKGKIIDAHAHIGFHDNQTLTKNDLDVFVKNELPNKDKVEKILVSDIDVLHGTKGEYQGNKDALKLFQKDTRYALFISCNPTNGGIKDVERLYKENRGKFIGLKFHPEIQKLEPSDSLYKPYLEFANKHKIPCLFHSQVNVSNKTGRLLKEINNFSDPQVIYDTAKKYKDAPFIMAHLGAGWNEAHDKAIDVLLNSIKNGDANLYADISWVDIGLEGEEHTNKDHIIKAIKKLKGIGDKNWTYGDQSYRLLFGTDIPLARFKPDENPKALENYTKFVEDIKTAIKSDKDLAKDSEKVIDDIFYNNAKRLYLDSPFIYPTKNKSKILLITTSILACLGALGYMLLENGSDISRI